MGRIQQQLRDITAPHVLSDWLVLGHEQGQGLDQSCPEMVDRLWPGPWHGCSFHPARSAHVDNFFWRATDPSGTDMGRSLPAGSRAQRQPGIHRTSQH